MYTLVENILPHSLLLEIKDELTKLHYKRCESTSDNIDISDISIHSTIQDYPIYMHSFYNYITPSMLNIGGNILNALKHYIPFEFDSYELIRFHTATVLKQPNYPSDKHTKPHVDWGYTEAKTILFYLDDSDGNTIFFDNEYYENFEKDIAKINFTISKQHTPKQNSAIIFNSNIIHASRPPIIYDTRTIFNIVLNKK